MKILEKFQLYPEWVQEFAKKYFTKTLIEFVLHGNIFDYVPYRENEDRYRYYKLPEYLSMILFRKRDLVITYDRSAGIQFRDPEMKEDFLRFLKAFDSVKNTQFSKNIPNDPTRAFALLENYFRIRLKENKRIALIIQYAETLVPASGTGFSSAEDRGVLVFLMRWAKESLFIQKDMTIVLLCDNLNLINPILLRNPFIYAIDLPHPNFEDRLHFIQTYLKDHPDLNDFLEMTPEVLAELVGGLTLVQIHTLLSEAGELKSPLTYEEITERKRELIEIETQGMLRFIDSPYTLDHVAGHHNAKRHLKEVVKAIQSGRTDVIPMGYLVCGPVGTGKTFLVSCFASEIGIPMVELRNFRSQWVGVTEANLERIFKILEAMAPVAVVIDEADAYLGNRSQSGDSGVSARVFSMIASFMSKPSHRGKIIWFLLTARPDLMPVDLKRQGRAEEHIALFYPHTREEKIELFTVMLKKTGIDSIDVSALPDSFFDNLPILSGAEMEAILTRAKFKAVAKNLPHVTLDILQETIQDFLPPTYPEEIELMNYVAVLECTSKELLPERYRQMSRDEVLQKIREIKAKLLLD